MAIYSISYDLKRVKNYPLLYGRLQSWGGKRLLLSQWMVGIAVPALTVVQILSQYIDDAVRLPSNSLLLEPVNPIPYYLHVKGQVPHHSLKNEFTFLDALETRKNFLDLDDGRQSRVVCGNGASFVLKYSRHL